MAQIAGHEFGMDGYCTLAKTNGEKCWMRFSDISPATKADIGKEGWSHYGTLSEREFQEIVKEVERVYAAHIAARGE